MPPIPSWLARKAHQCGEHWHTKRRCKFQASAQSRVRRSLQGDKRKVGVMYCTNCGEPIHEGARFCGACDNSAAATGDHDSMRVPRKRPVAGIVVAAICGFAGLLWCLSNLFRGLAPMSWGVAAALYSSLFPSFRNASVLNCAAGVIGNAALLVGTCLTFIRHCNGAKVVRVSCYCMLLLSLLLFTAAYFSITAGDAWRNLNASTQASITRGLVGALVGNILQWGIVLFLFRKR